MRDYHDTEWGVPLHDDTRLFEIRVLEGAQAGLSWSTVLNKRAADRKGFHGLDIARVERMTDAALDKLLLNAAIIRNRMKGLFGAQQRASRATRDRRNAAASTPISGRSSTASRSATSGADAACLRALNYRTA